MSVSHVFYQLLIRPLELIIEFAYGAAYGLTGNCGLSIFVLSLTVNLLLLPLYRRADAIQEEERNISQRLSRWVEHIKKTFTGDERAMMLQTYYRQNHYKPYYALRGMMPLVLEVPFFIAAYRFLSGLELLQGASFGSIRDLGAPDALLTLGGMRVNVLPLLMTLINFISSAVYTRGFALKDKLQLYGIALVFLILLYSSPAGLVLYWTLNNLFSLVKNLFYRIKNPRRVLLTGLSILGAALLVFALGFYRTDSAKHRLMLVLLAVLCELPPLLSLLRGRLPARRGPEGGSNGRLFWPAAVLLTLLTGALIPSAVIVSSPTDFVLFNNYSPPLLRVLDALLLAGGLFLVWFGLFWGLAGKRFQGAFALAGLLLSVTGLVNYMFFGTRLGTISALLQFGDELRFPAAEVLGNLALLLALSLLLFLIRKKQRLLMRLYTVLIAAVVGLSAVNGANILRAMPAVRAAVDSMPEEEVSFSLSREGRNVVVIMLDRAIGSYLPYLFNEKPELREQYAGFTCYPNTVSFGPHTLSGAPALFGGYEYTPEAMNSRPEESMAVKHTEALTLLPALFSAEGYAVTVFDPPFVGYGDISGAAVYDSFPNTRMYITETGQSSIFAAEDMEPRIARIWERNLFCYGLMKISPLLLQPSLYHQGNYFYRGSFPQTIHSFSTAEGYSPDFHNAIGELKALPEITHVEPGDQNTLLLLANMATHEPALLQLPDYAEADAVDNRDYDASHMGRFTLDGVTIRFPTIRSMAHYHVNMATLLTLGRWLDYLRAEGVYDNTRIILAADHGEGLRQFDSMVLGGELYADAMWFNPLLMVKDFDSREFRIDNSFMTNADVPLLALSGLVDNPVNPATGLPVTDAAKAAEQHICACPYHNTTDIPGSSFPPSAWYAVHDSIFDAANWTPLGTY